MKIEYIRNEYYKKNPGKSILYLPYYFLIEKNLDDRKNKLTIIIYKKENRIRVFLSIYKSMR